MWIVRVALSRPYTFIVLALLILIVSPLVILRTPTDIFPNINIPIAAVLWQYNGLNAEEMESRITTVFERILTTTVNDIEHTESQSWNGQAVVKIFFQPGAKIDMALSQVSSISQPVVRQMPPGTTPPFMMSFNASSGPDSATRAFRSRPVRAAIERLRHQFHPHSARHRARRRDSLAIRRQAAPGDGRYPAQRSSGQGTFGARYSQRRERAESDSARGDVEDRSVRVRCRSQRQPRYRA